MTQEVVTLARAATPNRKRTSQGCIAFALLVAFICAVFLIVGAHAVRGGVNAWTTHGPYGRSVRRLAIDPSTPSTLYALTDSAGVFQSTNSGASWSEVNTGLPLEAFVTVLAIDPHTPSTLYAGTNGSGVLQSTNSGASWSAVNTGFTSSDVYVNVLAIDPNAPSTLYAASYDYEGGGAVYQSTNSGGSWSAVNTGLTGLIVTALAIDPNASSTLYAVAGRPCYPSGCSGVVFRSTNSGGSWSPVNFPGLPVFDPITPTTLYAVGGDGVYKSTDSGGSWSAVNTGLLTYVNALVIDPHTPSTLYAASFDYEGVGAVYKSTDSGGSWSAVNTGLPLEALVYALAIDPHTPSTVYAATEFAGVYQSTNSGASWSAVNTGLPTHVNALAIDPNAPSTLYAGTDGGVFQSTNSGASWSWSGPPYANVRALAIDPHTPSTLYAGTDSAGVFRSTNSGASWSGVNTGLPNVYYVSALVIDPNTPSTLYIGTLGGGVSQSTNRGDRWSAVNTGLPLEASVRALAIDPQTPSTLYAGTGSGGVYQSTNSGASWNAVNTGLTGLGIPLAIDPTTPSTLYAGGGFEGGVVFQSTNSGASWSAVNTGLVNTAVDALAIDPHTPSTLYAGTHSCNSPRCSGAGVYQSTDSGASWSPVNAGLTSLDVNMLAIDTITTSRLYAGTGAGVFDIELACIVGTGTSASCTELALDACLPGGTDFTGAVTFDCGSEPATITVTSTKTISADTTIDGGSVIAISGGNSVGVFSVNTGIKLTIQNLTIANGFENDGNGGGQGIFNNGGALTVTNSTFSGNHAEFGGAIFNDGTATITNSTFSGNGTGDGGAIWNSGTATVTNSTFSGNHGVGGGAIFNHAGTLTVTNSTFSGNSVGAVEFPGCSSDGGAGIYNGGTLTVTNSTFSGNTAYCGGDGTIYSVGTGMVTNSTFSGNSAPSGGGAIYNGGTLTVTNSIVATSGCAGTITDGGHNIDDGTTCGFTGTGCTSTSGSSFCNTNPVLDPTGLKSNGGPTQTIALQENSQAINAGDEAVCAAPPVNNLDQRGYVRPGTGHTNCSIGAYEADSPGPSPCVGDCSNDGQVTVDEILTMVNIALGNVEISECDIGDASNDGQITVDEILMAVNNALNGCLLTCVPDCAGKLGGENDGCGSVCPDVTAPTVPAELSGFAFSCLQIILSWGASTDSGGSGLKGYNIYKNGDSAPLAQVSASATSFADGSLGPFGETDSYAVSAVDYAGNESAKSNTATATTYCCLCHP